MSCTIGAFTIEATHGRLYEMRHEATGMQVVTDHSVFVLRQAAHLLALMGETLGGLVNDMDEQQRKAAWAAQRESRERISDIVATLSYRQASRNPRKRVTLGYAGRWIYGRSPARPFTEAERRTFTDQQAAEAEARYIDGFEDALRFATAHNEHNPRVTELDVASFADYHGWESARSERRIRPAETWDDWRQFPHVSNLQWRAAA